MPQDGDTTLATAPSVPLDQIEWRVDGPPASARSGSGHVSRFVPYIDAAIVARLLDEWVGPGRWSDEYHPGELAGKPVLWCHLSIEVSPGEWVTKRDVGKPSNFEAEKGTVSDAFKRAACLKWGVGRNVYDVPGDLWAPCRTYTSNGKTHAAPNAETIPALIKQLTERGYSTEGVRVGGGAEEQAADAPTEGTAEPQGDDDAATRSELMELFNGLTTEYRDKVLDRLRKAEIIKRKTNGAIGTVGAQHFDTVRRTLEAAHAAAAGGPEMEPAAETPVPDDAFPGRDDGKPMPNQGTVEDPPAANGDGEEIPKRQQYLDGIELYRSQLSDSARPLWLGWLDEHHHGKSIEALTDDELVVAFEALAEIAAGATAPA